MPTMPERRERAEELWMSFMMQPRTASRGPRTKRGKIAVRDETRFPAGNKSASRAGRVYPAELRALRRAARADSGLALAGEVIERERQRERAQRRGEKERGADADVGAREVAHAG